MFDAHAHIGDITEEALVCTASTSDLDKVRSFPHFALGMIPEGGAADISRLEEAVSLGGCVGEIGLDRRYPDMPGQEKAFRAALSVAAESDRLAVIHCVRAYGRVYEIIRDMGIRRFMMHGYTGSSDMAERFLLAGGIISLSPRAEKTKNFKGLLCLPFVTETDMPTGEEERRLLSFWNMRLSEITGEDIERRSEEIMREVLCRTDSSRDLH